MYMTRCRRYLLRLGSEVIPCDGEGKEEGSGLGMSGRPADYRKKY